MQAQNLHIAELIEFQPGRVGLQGRRLLIHDLSALGQFRRDLIETVGEKMARRILTRKGFFWGQADAAGMQRLYTWDSLDEWLKAGAELLKISGKAQAEMNDDFAAAIRALDCFGPRQGGWAGCALDHPPLIAKLL
jgi:hypothetical protein